MVKSEKKTTPPDRKHNYLHCIECGGYYDLKEGESIGDFGNCQCGGELGYSDGKLVMKRKLSNSFNCPDCGDKISTKAKTCPNCGRPIAHKDIPPSEFSKMTSKDLKIIYLVIFLACFFPGLLVSFLTGNFYYLLKLMVLAISIIIAIYILNRTRNLYYFLAMLIIVIIITIGILAF